MQSAKRDMIKLAEDRTEHLLEGVVLMFLPGQKNPVLFFRRIGEREAHRHIMLDVLLRQKIQNLEKC